MKNKAYWLKRVEHLDKVSIKEAKKVCSLYKKQLIKTKKEIKALIALEIVEKKGMTEYEEYRINALVSDINNELDRLFNEEENMLNKALIDHYTLIYNELANDLKIDSLFGFISSEKATKAIAYKWSGLSFSERIWNRRNVLASNVKEIITKGFIRGDSIQDMARLLADKMDANYSRAENLIHTETRFVQSSASLDAFKDANVRKFEFMAYIDSRTSNVCRKLDGQIFDIEKAQIGTNVPPLHCRCRSAIAPIVE